MKHRGYTAAIEYDERDRIFHGRLVGTADQAHFEGRSVDELEAAFRAAVDDYLAYCEETGRAPSKPSSGRVNVRMAPELHRRAQIEAERSGRSLNGFITDALQRALP